MHGSFRDTFDNDMWTAPTPLTVENSRADKTNSTYEATLGGYLFKDKLWYFLAGRDRKTTGTDQTRITNIVFPTGQTEKRYEGKLTFALTADHRFVGSYLERKREWDELLLPVPPDRGRGRQHLRAPDPRGPVRDQLHRRPRRQLLRRGAVLGAHPPVPELGRRVQGRPHQGHRDLLQRPGVRRQRRHLLRRVRAGGPQQQGLPRQGLVVPLHRRGWARTTSWSATTSYEDYHFSVNHQSPSDFWFSAGGVPLRRPELVPAGLRRRQRRHRLLPDHPDRRGRHLRSRTATSSTTSGG